VGRRQRPHHPKKYRKKMQALEHITGETAERFRLGLLPPAELLAARAHAARCEECRELLAGAVMLDAAFTKIYAEFSGHDEEPEHLPYEQLTAFVDGSLDDVTREVAESHLAVCAECAGDADDLRQYQALAADTPTKLAPSGGGSPAKASGAWWRRLSTFNFIPSPGALVPTAAAAALIVAALFGLWVASRRSAAPDSVSVARMTPVESPAATPTPESSAQKSERPVELAALPTPGRPPRPAPQPKAPTATAESSASQVALDDGGRLVVFDARGGLRGLGALSSDARSAVRRSLETHRVETPRVLDGLAGAESGVLMGGATVAGEQAGVPFALVGPVGRVVREDRPVLRWRSLAGAVSYRASVVNSNFQIVDESLPTHATEWTPPAPLGRGQTYYWQVTATLADGGEIISPGTPAPRAKFRVLEESAADELRRLEESASESHLARGVLYARAGLVEEAEAEFRKLVTMNPRSPVARKLLQSVRRR
jgi:anti-sigma factor RsiW